MHHDIQVFVISLHYSQECNALDHLLASMSVGSIPPSRHVRVHVAVHVAVHVTDHVRDRTHMFVMSKYQSTQLCNSVCNMD